MFLVCGEALFDLFTREDDSDALRIEAHAGGSPFNVAISLARLGSRVAFLSGISNDPLGERLMARLRSEDVDDRYIVRSDRCTTLSLVASDRNGVPAYTFYGAEGADRSVAIGDVPPLGDDIRVIHCGSYTLVTPPFADTVATLVVQERARRLVTLDPNIRPNVEPDMQTWRARLDTLIPNVDLVKVSVEDLAYLHPGCPPESVCIEWQRRGPALVVLTRGHEGATAWSAGGSVSVAAPKVDVADTVGAGDAFQAAMLHWLAQRDCLTRGAVEALPPDQLQHGLAVACAAAADTCTRRGADLRVAVPQPPSE